MSTSEPVSTEKQDMAPDTVDSSVKKPGRGLPINDQGTLKGKLFPNAIVHTGELAW